MLITHAKPPDAELVKRLINAGSRKGAAFRSSKRVLKLLMERASASAGLGDARGLLCSPRALKARAANETTPAAFDAPAAKPGLGNQPLWRMRAAKPPWVGPGQVIITSYALLQQDAERLQQLSFGTAVLDEAQLIKNTDRLRAKAACGLKARRRVAATGTPVETRRARHAARGLEARELPRAGRRAHRGPPPRSRAQSVPTLGIGDVVRLAAPCVSRSRRTTAHLDELHRSAKSLAVPLAMRWR